MSIFGNDNETHRILNEILESVRNGNRISNLILQAVSHNFTVQLTLLGDTTMAIGNINAGGTGQLGAALLDNGAPVAGFTGTFAFTSSDAQVTIAPATTDASGGTIPLANQVVISVAAGDPGTSVTITANTTAPDGSTATGTLTITLTPTPQKFTVAVTQLA